MQKKILIDNNIIDFKNIEIMKNTNIFELIRTNQFTFFASEKLFVQLVPFLKKCAICERKNVINFIEKLTDKNRIFDTVKNISQKELNKQEGQFWFLSTETQKKINYSALLSDNILDSILLDFEKDFSSQNEKVAHSKIIEYMDEQRRIIQEYSKKSYKNVDTYLTNAMKDRNFDEKTINAVLNIVKKCENEDLSTEEKKKQIYKNYYNLMLEFSLLLQLRDDGKLISDKNFFDEYYKNYYNIAQIYPFTKKMLKITLYGYSYKVVGEDNPKYDKDWSNDNSYLCYMTYADILLTNDKGYMRSAFNSVYSGTGKEILTLDEFISKYSKIIGNN